MRKKTTAGYSLIEILVALVISSILMYGVISILISSKRTYGLQDEMAKLQDNARFVMEDMAYSLRMTRFKGCAGQDASMKNPFPNLKMIDGANNNPITDDKGNAFPPSDTLKLRFLNQGIKFDLSPVHYNSDGQYSPATLDLKNPIYLSDDSFLPAVGDSVIVVDCRTTTRTTVKKNSADNPLTAEGSPSYILVDALNTDPFNRPIDIFPMKLSSILYEVRWNPGAHNFVLYKEDADNPKYDEPFIEGVENLQIRYGHEQTAGVVSNGLVYNESPDGGDVRSVRITLLMRTVLPRYDLEDSTDKNFPLDTNLTATSIPGLSGGNYNPSKNVKGEEHYRHRLFTTTVQVRND